MKLKLIAISLFSILFFPECKKGEDDPAFSLRSRNARITGEWKLISLDIEVEYKLHADSNTVFITDKFNNANRHITIDGNLDSFNHREVLRINKDGSYSVNQSIRWVAFTISGGWYWAGKSYELDLKNKEAIVFTELNFTGLYDYEETIQGRVNPDYIYYIDRLANKEMIVDIDYKHTDTDGYYFRSKGILIFEKQDWD